MTISRHLLRRRARARAASCRRYQIEMFGRLRDRFEVEPAVRGPFRWRVVRYPGGV